MKKIIALFLSLCMACCCLSALAEKQGNTSYTYQSEAIGLDLEIPTGLTVTSEQETEEGAVQLLLSIDGRDDAGMSVVFSQNEAYNDYTFSTMPEDMLNEFIQYYSSLYQSSNPPSVMQFSEDESAQYMDPLFVSGKGQDGNNYLIYIACINGLMITVSLGYSNADGRTDSECMNYLLDTYILMLESFSRFMESGEAE